MNPFQLHRPKPGDQTPAFCWASQKPSDFNTAYARANVEIGRKITALHDAKPRVEPTIRKRVSKVEQAAIALESPQERRDRHARNRALRDNRGSAFNVEIPSAEASARTRAIGNRR